MKTKRMAIAAAFIMMFTAAAMAAPQLYVESAPNVHHGASGYSTWWDATQAEVVAGTFSNLSDGTYPGTMDIHPVDQIVYSWGDGGKRLHWIYWLPETTLSELEGNFQVKTVVDWGGTDYTYDWINDGWASDDPETGWVQPGSWANYEDGVIGTFGHAWWAGHGITDPEDQQAAFDSLVDDVLNYQTFADGLIRYRESAELDWQYQSLGVSVIPEPATLSLLAMGGLALLKRRRRA